MSKYTRLNKINHYHDSGSSSQQSEIESNKRIEPSKPLTVLASPVLKLTSKTTSMKSIQQQHRRSRSSSSVVASFLGFKQTKNYSAASNVKMAFFACISLLLILLVLVDGVQSLNCYHCSSVDNPECDEAFTGRANITETDCEKHIGRPAKVCRKIIQYIEDKKVVIRSCGFIEEHEGKEKKAMCYKRSGTFAIMMESCNCYTDNCNHSASLVPHQSVLLLLTSCSVLYYLSHHFYYMSISNNRARKR